jgi:hypothetical protein
MRLTTSNNAVDGIDLALIRRLSNKPRRLIGFIIPIER